MSLSSTWPSSEPAIHEAQQRTLLLSTAPHRINFKSHMNMCYRFLLYHKKFTNSPFFKNTHHHITPFWHHPAHGCDDVRFCSTAVPWSRTFKIRHRKNDIAVDFDWSTESAVKLSGQHSYDLNGTFQLYKFPKYSLIQHNLQLLIFVVMVSGLCYN